MKQQAEARDLEIERLKQEIEEQKLQRLKLQPKVTCRMRLLASDGGRHSGMS